MNATLQTAILLLELSTKAMIIKDIFTWRHPLASLRKGREPYIVGEFVQWCVQSSESKEPSTPGPFLFMNFGKEGEKKPLGKNDGTESCLMKMS